MMARLIPFATLALLASGCFFWPATVHLDAYPHKVKPLPAAGVYDVTYSVEVKDAREDQDPQDLGRRRGTILGQPGIRSAGDPIESVQRAVVDELRLRDLRLQERGKSDVHLRVEVTRIDCRALRSPALLDMEGGEVRASIEGDVHVVDGRTAETLRSVPIGAQGRYSSMILSARKYEFALNDALTRFAARVIRHPDTLIAIQRIAGVLEPGEGSGAEDPR